METNKLILDYPEADGKINTIYVGDEVYFSLSDVVTLLATQNIKLRGTDGNMGLYGLIQAQIEVLDTDELKRFDDVDFVTQPGLFRIILRDNSAACKQFQRWVLHEVLPSIQKHGTYPPSLTEKDSDVKRAVQILLSEIEEREQLEKRTKEQFKRHETMINDLSKKISCSPALNKNNNFISVKNYCNSNDIDIRHEQIITGWCIKIVAEEGEHSAKYLVDGKEIPHFPEHIIAKADKSRTS